MSDPSEPDSTGTTSLETRPWYQPRPKHIGDDVRRILEKNGVLPTKVEDHIVAVRDRAWQVKPYVCFGKFMFTEMKIQHHPCFGDMIKCLRDREGSFLDVGCGLGQEIRFLVDRGVDGSHLTGIDYGEAFIKLGYELFQDRKSLKARFASASILDLTSMPTDMHQKFDIVWGSASFHLFNWEEQIEAFTNAVALMKDKEGVALYGWQAGHRETKSMPSKEQDGKIEMFWHNPVSFRNLWDEIGVRTSTRWKVRSWCAGEVDNLSDNMAGVVEHIFAVERVSGKPGAEAGTHDNGQQLWSSIS